MVEEKEKKVLENKTNEDQKTKAAVEKPKANKLPWFLFIIVIAILASGYVFFNKRLTSLEQHIADRGNANNSLIESLDLRIKETVSRNAKIEKQLGEIESKQLVLENLIPESVSQPIQINEEYALAEIEHLLIIASYRLQLNRDVATALFAMEAADTRLQDLDIPNVIQTREQLIADMNELRSLNQADLSGLGLFLSDLINRVDTLPLNNDVVIDVSENTQSETNEERQGNSIKEFFLLVWQELKSLVIITRDTNVSKTRLLPDEVYYLKANIKLELANARFAVFNRDTSNFHSSIEHIKKWLNEYFDMSDAAVKNIYDSLMRMHKLELAFPEIDISSSIESVRAMIRYQSDLANQGSEAETESLQ